MSKVVSEKDYVAVLISTGCGVGWSTWNRDHPELMFDPVLVKMVQEVGVAERSEEAGTRKRVWSKFKEDAKKYLSDKYEEYICTEGLDGLHIVWIKEGTKFFIRDDDGNETLHTISDIHWITA